MRTAALSLLLVLSAAAVASSQAEPPALVGYWGHRGSEPGAFSAVTSVATAPDGNVYVADAKGRIEKFTADGEFVLEWTVPADDNRSSFLSGLAVNPNGEVFATEFWNCRVQVFAADGTFLRRWGSLGSEAGQFDGPSAIAIDRHGDVYVADRGNSRIQKFSSAGELRTIWGQWGSGPGQFADPLHIAVGPDDRVYVGDTTLGGIQVFAADGSFLARWGSAPRPLPERRLVATPSTMANRGSVVPKGRLVAGKGSFDIGVPEPMKTSPGASLDQPAGVATAPNGNVYVIDGATDRVQQFSSDGDFLAAWPVLPTAEFAGRQTNGVAVAASGDIYVAELNGPAVRKFGRGPLLTERIVQDLGGADAVWSIDALLAMPLGARKADAKFSDSTRFRPAWGKVGFDAEPVLQSVAVEFPLPSSARGGRMLAAFADVVGRKLGAPASPVDLPDNGSGPVVHEHLGVYVRASLRRSAEGSESILLERLSAAVQPPETDADACDVRVPEGTRTSVEGIWEVLFRGLEAKRPTLAAAIRSNSLSGDALLAEVQRASGAGVPEDERALILLTADQWLRRPDFATWPLSSRYQLDDRWNALGFRSYEGTYCGSDVLRKLASETIANEWTDFAYLVELDALWTGECGYDSDPAPSIAPPSVDEYLAANASSPLWTSVALRAAMMRETEWGLFFDEDGNGADDQPYSDPAQEEQRKQDEQEMKAELGKRRAKADEDRRRATELYRILAPRAEDPRLKQAIEARLKALQDGEHGCTVYYEDPC